MGAQLLGLFFFGLLVLAKAQQRVAPGVPPQQYQHAPQMQHVPQHAPHQDVQYAQQQQVHMQQQQVHQQQMHQQIPQQQVPQQHVPQQMHQQHVPHQQQVPQQQQHGGHGHHPHNQQVLNAANVMNEKSHIQEHMDVPIDVSKMSEQELQFHYFKMHDADNNNKLDGCELIKSLIHWHEQAPKDAAQGGQHQHGQQVQEKIFDDNELVALIDPIMKTDDANGDGYIDYPEFVRAQMKAAAATTTQQQQQQQHH